MDRIKRKSKRLAIDIAGVALIICAPLLGWLPGPGGIPMFLAGLGLLSINHEWARNIREYLVAHGSKLTRILFPDNHIIQWIYDLFTVCLLTGAYFTYRSTDSIYTRAAATIVATAALAIFLINRERFSRVFHKIKRKKKA